MSEYNLIIEDNRPTLVIKEESTTLVLSAPGPQGAQGDQKVFVQASDPAIEHSWGPEDAGKVWIVTGGGD